MENARKTNTDIWEKLYGQGLIIAYPNDVFVRVSHRLFDPAKQPRLLDYGFGSGQNAAHLIKRGFAVSGVEVSASAVKSATALLAGHGVKADLRLTEDGRIPWDDASFDGVVAWGVLEYNDWGGLAAAVAEIDRVLRPGGVFLGAINAPGDFKHKHAKPLGGGLFSLDEKTGGQRDAKVIVVDRDELPRCFPGRDLTIGHYEHDFGPTYARHWIVSYVK